MLFNCNTQVKSIYLFNEIARQIQVYTFTVFATLPSEGDPNIVCICFLIYTFLYIVDARYL
jgi:hypothetical protein